MMRAHLDDAHERGEPIAALWASEEAIYGRFGYGRAAFAGEIAVPREHVDVRRAARAARAGPARRAGRGARGVPAALGRGRARAAGDDHRARASGGRAASLADPPDRRDGGGPKRLALLEQDGAPAGYAIYRHHFGYDDGLVDEQGRGRRGGRRRAGRGRGGLALPARHRLDGDDHGVARPARPPAVLPPRASRGG